MQNSHILPSGKWNPYQSQLKHTAAQSPTSPDFFWSNCWSWSRSSSSCFSKQSFSSSASAFASISSHDFPDWTGIVPGELAAEWSHGSPEYGDLATSAFWGHMPWQGEDIKSEVQSLNSWQFWHWTAFLAMACTPSFWHLQGSSKILSTQMLETLQCKQM